MPPADSDRECRSMGSGKAQGPFLIVADWIKGNVVACNKLCETTTICHADVQEGNENPNEQYVDVWWDPSIRKAISLCRAVVGSRLYQQVNKIY